MLPLGWMNCGANACAGTGGAPTELTDIPARAHTNDTLRGSELTERVQNELRHCITIITHSWVGKWLTRTKTILIPHYKE